MLSRMHAMFFYKLSRNQFVISSLQARIGATRSTTAAPPADDGRCHYADDPARTMQDSELSKNIAGGARRRQPPSLPPRLRPLVIPFLLSALGRLPAPIRLTDSRPSSKFNLEADFPLKHACTTQACACTGLAALAK
eukprot:12422660-Karenia_brevis.AAC.2